MSNFRVDGGRGAGGSTDITVSERADDVQIRSSTGSNDKIDPATTSVAGVMLPADRTHLNAIPPVWTPDVYEIGDQVVWNDKVYSCEVPRQATDTDDPDTDTDSWAEAQQKVLNTQSDGSEPTPQAGALWVSNSGVSYGHVDVTHATDPVVNNYTAFTHSDWVGVHSTSTRPDAATHQGDYLYNSGVGSFQQSYQAWGTVYAWRNVGTPFSLTFRGYFETEAEATAHIQDTGEAVIFGDVLYTADDFTAGVDRTETVRWFPVDEGQILDLVTLTAWQDEMAQSTAPSDADLYEDQIVGGLIPVDFPRVAAGIDRYFHLQVPRPYVIDSVHIVSEDRFTDFTLVETATDRRYDSPEVAGRSARDLLVRVSEGAA